MINFFRVPAGGYLVDLPGYGHAEVPEPERVRWRSLLEHYLLQRPTLVGLILIMDARRPMTELDRRMIDWFTPTRQPIHVLLTKSDKLGRGESTRMLAQARHELSRLAPAASVQLFSSACGRGVEEAEARIRRWFECASEQKEKPPTKGEKAGG